MIDRLMVDGAECTMGDGGDVMGNGRNFWFKGNGELTLFADSGCGVDDRKTGVHEPTGEVGSTLCRIGGGEPTLMDSG